MIIIFPSTLDPCTGDRCKNGGTCHVSGHIFNCVCRAPFSGVTCEENVCTDNPCLNGGTCYLDGSSFKCKCRRPYFEEKCDKETNMTITDELTEIVKDLNFTITDDDLIDNWTSRESSVSPIT
ncbi:hypothetical protein TNCT_114921 [Trichonephila clavata]|uniref:EGF-like domain-containing protein n=1 Tax=Trichonephila clavata TaxID=2740835 RepID=A0A8X6HVG2_TRICU|nr:hypothetical protein TNCT_114921 [Trichonephila clavata]